MTNVFDFVLHLQLVAEAEDEVDLAAGHREAAVVAAEAAPGKVSYR